MITALAIIAFGLFCGATAQAHDLIVYNEGTASATCYVSGNASPVVVAPAARSTISAPAAGIDQMRCGDLHLGHLGVVAGADGYDDRIVILNGRQQRTLRVALFPYLPSSPAGDLTMLTRSLEERFQARFPNVALQLVMSQAVNPYDYTAFRDIFGDDGYDVVEVDTSVLSSLTAHPYIVPVKRTGEVPLPFAAQAVAAADGRVWGIPTWICRDFLFGWEANVSDVRSVEALQAYWATLSPSMKVVADFGGRFQLYSMYLNAYVARHGYGDQQVRDALNGPVDPASIRDLVTVVSGCMTPAGKDPCIDGTFHSALDGTVEPLFANGTAGGDVGYSERSFYFEVGNKRPFSLVPMPYGPSPVNLMYVDALVQSAARCAGDPCASDAASFARFLDGPDVRAFIAFADDLRPGNPSVPPRHLLPATQSFYALPRVTADPVYAAVAPLFGSAHPMPTTIDDAVLTDVDGRICSALKVRLPIYKCKLPTSKGTSQ